ncbi:hypothetical protein RCL_jg25989.t1 [Rhizophagus clarus]|uniref:Uncharacterized protein n=1 Tax=Rhizophagus clarus TaxID=94130 RepID=A0A8H3QHL2_9GLOM|nr:hypothetical protein RCL_jg25989.t1 [Rhizophagus clarus]
MSKLNPDLETMVSFFNIAPSLSSSVYGVLFKNMWSSYEPTGIIWIYVMLRRKVIWNYSGFYRFHVDLRKKFPDFIIYLSDKIMGRSQDMKFESLLDRTNDESHTQISNFDIVTAVYKFIIHVNDDKTCSISCVYKRMIVGTNMKIICQ